jgi:hypothetical protein
MLIRQVFIDFLSSVFYPAVDLTISIAMQEIITVVAQVTWELQKFSYVVLGPEYEESHVLCARESRFSHGI